jgi:hypothetical protein
MKVETYEAITVDEQNGSVVNELVSEEALALITSLDLAGQRTLLETKKVAGEEVVTRNPYRQITAEERAIYRAILPRTVDLAKYADGPIPLRVLQVAGHAKGLFPVLQIWCPADPQMPDPLLIGRDSPSTWSGNDFILARWGDILEPLDVLRVSAKRILLARLKADIAKARAGVTAFESGLDEKLDAYLLGGEAERNFGHTLSFAT